ncbi:MAG: trigger factor [Anaerolineae bacterium]|nr:trigger factor [Anaerolineae bacterium]
MTLTVHTEEDEQRQLALTVEVPEDDVKQAMRQAARKLAGEVRVPGFRKGKAPYSVIVSRVGEEYLRSEAIEDLVQPSFEEALQEIDVIPYAQPSLDNIEPNPLVFKFTVPLEPTVALDEAYRELRKDVEAVEITDEAIDEALEQIQIRHQVVEPVERAVESGDLISLSGKGVLAPAAKEDDGDGDGDGETAVVEPTEETLFNEEQIELLMDAEILFPGTPFVENLLGLTAGDEKSFSFTFPEDFDEEELAGREASFEITVLDVKSRTLPELNDELAQLEGAFETLAELRESLQDNLKTQAESEAKNELIEGMIDDLVEKATIVYPPAAVEDEIDSLVRNMKQQMERSGWLWDDYLKIQGLNEETVRDNFRKNAEESLKRRLVLRQFIISEKLSVKAEDVDAKIEERIVDFGDNEDLRNSMRQYFSTGYGFDMLSSEILMDKMAARAKAIYMGEAPDLAELEAAEAADEEE